MCRRNGAALVPSTNTRKQYEGDKKKSGWVSCSLLADSGPPTCKKPRKSYRRDGRDECLHVAPPAPVEEANHSIPLLNILLFFRRLITYLQRILYYFSLFSIINLSLSLYRIYIREMHDKWKREMYSWNRSSFTRPAHYSVLLTAHKVTFFCWVEQKRGLRYGNHVSIWLTFSLFSIFNSKEQEQQK